MKYLDKISNEKLNSFLNDNGLIVLDDLNEVRNTGCSLTVLDEHNNEVKDNNDADIVFIRCASSDNIETETFAKVKAYFMEKFPIISANTQSYFNSRIHLFSVNDFIIQRLFVLDELTEFDYQLQKNYHSFMMTEFSDTNEYEKDYENYVNEITNEM
jgi:ERCC4-type nuclease